ncbi:addiction module protein [Algoriphagus sp. H41]|uniref:Addiction module protein n=1 Tax=Algoriphagus oliviformis TaxID=2811231 RepID=A0ABS3C4Z7_9BACT|nr:addiction module protein [Algoriphagus oliviformis]MBN7812197.1 addiction module protein [Algoriphagus oliviformis]
MRNSNIKEELHAMIEKADSEVLELVYSILNPAGEDPAALNGDQVAELERRYAAHLEKPEEGSTWEEVKGRISKKNR